MLTRRIADELLEWAGAQNPGPWTSHSKQAARAAELIAAGCGLDADRAYCLGLLHDIGRYKGPSAMMHILDGYNLLMERGYPQAAQICITHSFPTQTFAEYSGVDDCTPDDRQIIVDALGSATYTDYDRLIQLCDSLSLPEGICLMEKRLIDVALRHGTNDLVVPKWKALFSIFNDFESRLGSPLYSLFPEVVGNTFPMLTAR